MDMLDRMPFKARNAVFERLENIGDLHSLSKEEKERYENSIDAMRDYNATIDYAVEKGIAEGEAKGKAEGLEEGKNKEKRSIALNLKKKGFDISEIIEITGLSEDEILKL